MKLEELSIPWAFILKCPIFNDERGSFQKPFTKRVFQDLWLEYDFQEAYYTVSRKNTIRGMHFQTPEYDHAKLVYVSSWEIQDVLLDIRIWSPSYGKTVDINISSENGVVIYIPKWVAHWFVSKVDCTIVNYLQTSVYCPEHDTWIHYDSIEYDWWDKEFTISTRDLHFKDFSSFKSPFIYQL